MVWIAACSTGKLPDHPAANTPFDALLGSWEGPLGNGIYSEHWRKVSATQLKGEGYWVKNGDTVLVENLHIQQFGDHWAYVAIINDSEPTLFTLVQSEPQKWVFENKEHDYPQLIGYQIEGPASLYAWTDGMIKGKARKDEYRMKKVE